jgi:methylamine dehydrogenase heavy chain
MRWGPARALALVAALVAGASRADVALDSPGVSLSLEKPGPHWIWLSDFLLRRAALFDVETGRMLGSLTAGVGSQHLHFAPDRSELYVSETHYSRATRGERSDVVTVYDAATLEPRGEVAIPAKRGDHASGGALSALGDDGRFLAVWNLTPASSLSIVDVRERRFAGEIDTSGCSLVYAAGPRQYLLLCGDGAALVVTLDERGREASKQRSAPFFDPLADPVTEKAVRYRDEWLFVSFEGMLHAIDASSGSARVSPAWSLLDAADRGASWRIGGAQHLAVHAASGRLYVLVHQGGVDTHKQAGTEVWVYDLAARRRVERFATRNPTAGFLEAQLGLDGPGVGAELARWLLNALVPNPGVDRILVTPGAAPRLVTLAAFPALLSVHDAETGELLRDVREAGIAGSLMGTP